MSKWKGKALECLPGLKESILGAKDRQSLWQQIEREFHAAVQRGDVKSAAGCIRYAAWTLHPAPQAKTMADVSELAANFLYTHADELHQWIDRYDFMLAQKGLKFHLGAHKYSEFETRFLAKMAQYPCPPKDTPSGHRTKTARIARPDDRTSSVAGSEDRHRRQKIKGSREDAQNFSSPANRLPNRKNRGGYRKN